MAADGLNKIRAKEWAEPLGVGLKVTGEIFQMAGEAGLPVIGLIGKIIKLTEIFVQLIAYYMIGACLKVGSDILSPESRSEMIQENVKRK